MSSTPDWVSQWTLNDYGELYETRLASLKTIFRTTKKQASCLTSYGATWATADPRPPDFYVAVLCGAKKRKNQGRTLRSSSPHPPTIERSGEFFIGGEPRRILKGNAVTIETNYWYASKKSAVRHLEKLAEKDFSEKLQRAVGHLEFEF